MLSCMRDGKMCSGRTRLLIKLANATVKDENRRAGWKRGYFYVLPCDAARPTRLKRFKRSFFGSEACGIMLWRDYAARVAVRTLVFRKDALGKARRAS